MSNIINPKANTAALGYTGQVTIKLVKDKKILKTQTYKNAGMPYLFRTLASALVGESIISLPGRLCLYAYKDQQKPEDFPQGFTWKDQKDNLEPVMYPILYSVPPQVIFTGTEDLPAEQQSFGCKFQFNVPYSVLQKHYFDVAVLFPCKEPILEDNICAYFLYPERQKLDEDLAASGNYSLFIEWDLYISNINKEEEE
jgi:hypothetical protein